MTISAITSTWLRTLMRRKDYVTKLSSITSDGSQARMTIMMRLSRKPHAVFSRPDATERLAKSNITGMSDKSPAKSIPAAALEGSAPASLLSRRGMWRLLWLIGLGLLIVVVFTHVAERFHIFPAMGWGQPNTIGHYLDLVSAIFGCALLLVGLVGALGRR